MNPHGALGLALASTLAALGLLLLAAAPALAAESHAFESTFNASEAPGGSFSPLGLAVDNSGTASDGHVYVGDTEHAVVDVFEASGKYLSQVTGSETAQHSLSLPWGLALDQSGGDLYVADVGTELIDKFDSSGALVKAFGTEGQLSGAATPQAAFRPFGVAVDPKTGDLYVGDGNNNLIDVFTSSGAYLRQFASNGTPLSLAIDSQGNLFAANETETDVYTAATGELNTSYGAGSGVLDSGGSLGVTVNPANDDVYVADSEHIAQYDKTGKLIASFGSGHLGGAFGVGVGDTAAKVYTANRGAADASIFGPLVPDQVLKVTKPAAGTVTSSPPGIQCGATCEGEFEPGATITLTASGERANFEAWTGCAEEPSETECKVTLGPSVTEVKAEFTPIPQEALTVEDTGLGTGNVTGTSPGSEFTAIDCGNGPTTCAETYNQGATITLTATAPEHNRFVAWTGCQTESGPECTVTMSAAKQVKADFINLYLLTVVPTGPGSISAASGAIANCPSFGGVCSGEYDETSTLILTASPFPHHHAAWEAGDCKSESGPANEECEVEIGTAPAEVKATFPPNLQTLTLTPTGPGSVTANSGPLRNCSEAGGTCAGKYIETATLTLFATPGPGQAVTWEGCTAVSSPDTCEVQIGASETAVKAGFAPITHALTVNKAGSGQGSITCNGGPCAGRYPEGTALTIAAIPAAGSTFAGWSGGGCSGTGTCHLTLEADAALTATFNAKPPPPAEEHCLVPKLTGDTQGQAASALTAAHCTLGTVTKPKKKGHLVVKSSSPAAGTSLPLGSAVNLKLSLKPKKKKH